LGNNAAIEMSYQDTISKKGLAMQRRYPNLPKRVIYLRNPFLAFPKESDKGKGGYGFHVLYFYSDESENA
jgi:hypothetical protein